MFIPGCFITTAYSDMLKVQCNYDKKCLKLTENNATTLHSDKLWSCRPNWPIG